MGIVSALRRAEEHARKAAQAGMESTIVALDDAERALRRRMRVYPSQMPAIRAQGAKPVRPTAAPAQPVEKDEATLPKVS